MEYYKKKRIGWIRGSKKNMSKRHNWITNNSLVLISLRTFSTSDDKCDIIKLYNEEEVHFLLKHKKIHYNFVKNGSFQNNNNNELDNISFTNNQKSNNKKKERSYNDLYDDISEETDEDTKGIDIDLI